MTKTLKQLMKLADTYAGWQTAGDWQSFRDSLESALRELIADAERIDWLEQADGRFHNIDRISSVSGRFNKLKSLRAAIDAQRKASAAPPFDCNAL